jgi:hypothetical protein
MQKKIPKWVWSVVGLLIAALIGPIVVYYLTTGREPVMVTLLNPSTATVAERFVVEWEPAAIPCKIKVYQAGTMAWNKEEPDRSYRSGQANVSLTPNGQLYERAGLQDFVDPQVGYER